MDMILKMLQKSLEDMTVGVPIQKLSKKNENFFVHGLLLNHGPVSAHFKIFHKVFFAFIDNTF